jgi:hypothetical protein
MSPISVLRTSETTDRATVSSQPCQKALRYLHSTSQFRVVDANNAQEMREKTANKKKNVAAFAQNGDGERGLSRKLPNKLLTGMAVGLVRVEFLARSPTWGFASATYP